MYKYIGLILFLLLLVMTGFCIYQAVTGGGVIYIIFSVILVLAVVLQLKKMVHISITYEDKEEDDASTSEKPEKKEK